MINKKWRGKNTRDIVNRTLVRTHWQISPVQVSHEAFCHQRSPPAARTTHRNVRTQIFLICIRNNKFVNLPTEEFLILIFQTAKYCCSLVRPQTTRQGMLAESQTLQVKGLFSTVGGIGQKMETVLIIRIQEVWECRQKLCAHLCILQTARVVLVILG